MSWVDEVVAITEGDRRRDYGHPLINFLRIAIRWSLYLKQTVSPVDVALLMVEVKLSRQQQTYKEDNFIDIMGYTACVEAMDTKLKEYGYPQGVRVFDTMDVNGYIILLKELEL